MTMLGQSELLSVNSALDIAAITTDTTTNGDNIDRSSWESVTLVLLTGAYTDGTYTINVQHANDDGAGSPDTWEDAAATDLVGSEGALSAANSRAQIGYVGERKWVRLQVVSTSTSSGATVGGSYILGNARHES